MNKNKQNRQNKRKKNTNKLIIIARKIKNKIN